MKFLINDDMFSTNVTNVDLSDREVDYIVMLVSGVKEPEIKRLLNMSHSELETLYNKFGLTNKKKVRDMQLTSIMCMNNLITIELITQTKERFDLIELQEMIDFYKTGKRG